LVAEAAVTPLSLERKIEAKQSDDLRLWSDIDGATSPHAVPMSGRYWRLREP
jgi:hypothetical protein